MIYAMTEPALFTLVSAKRREQTRSNGYARACGMHYWKWLTERKPPQWKAKVQKEMYEYRRSDFARCSSGARWNKIKATKYFGCRYFALNLHSWIYRGTVELRLPAGTTMASKIIRWGTIWASLVDYAAQHSESQIMALLGDHTDPSFLSGEESYSILQRVTPSNVHAWMSAQRRANA